jgi:branched-chain amino acid transport system permease protein
VTDFLQQVVAGLASGGIYASLALAVVLIYRTTRVVNFAQGEMAMFTTFVAWTLMDHGLGFWPAFVLTLAIAFVGGVAIERIVLRPVEGAPVLTVVIVTIGLALLVNGLAAALWGSEVKSFRSAFSTRAIDVGGVAVSVQDIGVITVSIAIVLVLWLFFRFTKLGLALRAAAVNPDESRLVGIRVGWMLALGWGLAAVLGAVAGMLVAPTVFLEPNMMRAILLYAFAAAVLGGMDSPVGAVVGGLAFGVIQNLVETYIEEIGATLRLPVALALLLVVLLVRPQGLFGRAAVRRV